MRSVLKESRHCNKCSMLSTTTVGNWTDLPLDPHISPFMLYNMFTTCPPVQFGNLREWARHAGAHSDDGQGAGAPAWAQAKTSLRAASRGRPHPSASHQPVPANVHRGSLPLGCYSCASIPLATNALSMANKLQHLSDQRTPQTSPWSNKLICRDTLHPVAVAL